MLLRTAFKVLARPEKYSEEQYRKAVKRYVKAYSLAPCPVCDEILMNADQAKNGKSCFRCMLWLGTNEPHNDKNNVKD